MKKLLSLLLLILFVGDASAEIVYDVYYRVGAFESIDGNFSVNPNTTLDDVQVVVRETIGDPVNETSLMAGGIQGFAFNLIADDLNWITDANVTDGFFQEPASSVPALMAVNFPGDYEAVTKLSDSQYEFVLGTVDLAGPALPGQQRIFSIRDRNPGSNFDQQLSTGAIDNLITTRTLTLTAVAVPEPSTALALLGGLGCLIATGRRRRRRK
ncbi:hypothetical protein SV7mr_43500 [Stieleria bergensis]|uniref:Ice-binding protein C-terminal domain-containing protein n=1 Tax=Stieleria bergensis TaxID=2528025 RepID=A0A517T088_9BACT|nr:hypothetical protein SV7mr_43500 [Planctomycetes bacterium SV_7m_r]